MLLLQITRKIESANFPAGREQTPETLVRPAGSIFMKSHVVQRLSLQ